MNGGDYRTEHREVNFDQTECLQKVLDLVSRREDKYALFKLLSELSHDEVEILKCLGQLHAELAGQMPAIFETLLQRHEKSLRLRKLAHLWRLPELEEEAIRKAVRDTGEMMRAMSPVGNQTIQALLLNRAQVVRGLSGTMLDMMLEDTPVPHLLEGMRSFLEGEVAG